jgi:hypothetical protein
VLGLFTALVHLIVLNLDHFDPLFTLNGVGYLALLAAYFLPVAIFIQNRNLVRWVFIIYTALTILAYVFFAVRDPSNLSTLGNITKLVELVLIVLLIIDRRPRMDAR